MDGGVETYFTEVIRLAQTTFKNVSLTQDETPKRAILRIEATYGKYRIVVAEVVSPAIRKYSYYVLAEIMLKPVSTTHQTRVHCA